MTSGPNWYQIGSKTCYIPKVGKFYVEIGSLKVLSLACKCVFYRLEHNAKVEPHGTEF